MPCERTVFAGAWGQASMPLQLLHQPDTSYSAQVLLGNAGQLGGRLNADSGKLVDVMALDATLTSPTGNYSCAQRRLASVSR